MLHIPATTEPELVVVRLPQFWRERLWCRYHKTEIADRRLIVRIAYKPLPNKAFTAAGDASLQQASCLLSLTDVPQRPRG
jgi:hypothetical protein